MTDKIDSTATPRPRQTVLDGQAAVDLWLRGKAGWNAWAETHRGWTVSFADVDFAAQAKPAQRSIDFSSFVFPGPTIFRGAKFEHLPVNFARAVFRDGYTDFTYCEFGDEEVSFFETDFGNGSLRFDHSVFGAGFTNFFSVVIGPGADTSFHHARFNGPLSFKGAKFRCLNRVGFRGASFAASVDFSDVTAATAIDLRGTQAAHALSLDNCRIGLIRHRQGPFLVARNDDDVACFRRLKQIAIDSRDHLREQDFFRKEQLAGRHIETTGLALVPSYLYEWLSDFGRSILRPTVFLALVMLLPAVIDYVMAKPSTRSVASALLLSMGQLPGLSSWSAQARDTGIEALFGDLASVPFGIQVLALLQGVLATIGLFLIGLGIRNRFRL